MEKKRRYIIIIAASTLVSLVLIGVIVFLLTQMDKQKEQMTSASLEQERQLELLKLEQEGQLKVLQLEHENEMALLYAEREELNQKITEQDNELIAHRNDNDQLRREIEAVSAQLNSMQGSMQWEIESLTAYIVENSKNLSLNNDERASTIFMPKEAIALLDKLVAAISAGDEALYISILGYKNKDEAYEYHGIEMSVFEKNKNKALTLSKIEPGINNIAKLQQGGYFVRVTAVDDKGNEEVLHSAIGMNRPYGTYWGFIGFD